MNKAKTIDREAAFWKFLFKIQKVNPLKHLFGKHYLDRGSVNASEIDWTHGKIQHKIHLKSTMRSAVKKTRLNSSKDDFLMKSFPSPQKESRAFFWTFSFHFLSFNSVFLTLKCRTLVLKHLHGDGGSHFVENGYASLMFLNMVKVNIHEWLSLP